MNKLNKYLVILHFLLLNIIGQNIIQCAARIETKEAAELNLELITASGSGNAEKVMKSIKQGANLDAANIDGHTALIRAALFENIETVKLLIKHNANVNIADIHGSTVLIWAACYDQKEIVELLLKAGANIEHKNKAGNKAIDFNDWGSELIKNNKQEIAKMLEGEQSRREAVVKKWIKDKFAKEITEATSEQLFSDIANIIAEYSNVEYTDIPLEYRLAS